MNSTGVSNIIRSQDADGRRIVEYDIEEWPITIHGAVKAIEEDVSTRANASLLGLFGGMIQINQGYDLTDAEDGREGTMLVDYAEYTAPRILARFVLRKGKSVHVTLTQNLRQHFEEMS